MKAEGGRMKQELSSYSSFILPPSSLKKEEGPLEL